MNCEAFRREYQSLLDKQEAERLTPDMASHLAACPTCPDFAAAMKAVDGALREQEYVPIAASLVEDLQKIPLKEMRGEFALRRYLWKGLAITVPGASVIFLGMLLLPPVTAFWLQLAVLTSGLSLFWINALKHRRLSVSLE